MKSGLVAIAIFAHNEELSIKASLDAVRSAVEFAGVESRIFVLINGCKDDTENVVRLYAQHASNVQPVVIAAGDKSNAWNVYTHDVAPPDATMHVFTDGDVRVNQAAIVGLMERLAAEREANACAGLPSGGRSEVAFRARLLQNHELAGNLYAVRGACLMQFREQGVRLPFGMIGEDGLVTTLIKCDLDMQKDLNHARIAASEIALFHYDQLSPWKRRDWRIYRNRRVRYAVRRHQNWMLFPLLYEKGTTAMPAHVVELYRDRHAHMPRGWNGIDTVFDWIARRRILRDLKASEGARTGAAQGAA